MHLEIIYQSTKGEFIKHVEEDIIEQEIYNEYRSKIGRTSQNERAAWEHSMQYMYKVLNSEMIPNDVGIAIEYRIPTTAKRVDFIITGENEKDEDAVIIIELKQWEKVDVVDKQDIVRTYVGHKERELAHPSYQVWSYATIIRDYNENVQEQNIALYPCSYLHNYIADEKDPILDERLYECLKRAPLFKKGDVNKLRHFISTYIKKADQHHILYKIENGKVRPSKALQDSLLKMLNGNQEFVLIDSQKVAYETILQQARMAFQTQKKQVTIVEGGPVTGKSVLAINLLVELTNESMVGQYISKNSAPRAVYKQKLQSQYRKSYIDNLFKGTGNYYTSKRNEIDVLIVDEAHRLNEKSGIFKNKGENQTKEIIHASKCSVFFIDECQRVTARLIDFWQWAYSDLIGNTERGILAEYLVACALGIEKKVRISWGKYDLSFKGLHIEVKTSGYLQTWDQEKLSKISFGIAKTRGWNEKTNEMEKEKKRQADIYIFCVHKHKKQESRNPLDVSQWSFYILTKKILDEKAGDAKTISLQTLVAYGAIECEYGSIYDVNRSINDEQGTQREKSKVASCDATLLLDNIDKLHSTEGGILRVRNNLKLGDIDIVKWCQEKVQQADAVITKKGKNWYVYVAGCKLTINGSSYTNITAHQESSRTGI